MRFRMLGAGALAFVLIIEPVGADTAYGVDSTATFSSSSRGGPKETLDAEDKGRFRIASSGSYWKGRKVSPVGTLAFPDGDAEKYPAMIILHGSGGQGYRDATWADFLNANGIASLKVDYFSPRNISSLTRGGPIPVQDVWAAIAVLSTHPRIDAERIGVMGFSRGGTMTLTSTRYRLWDTNDANPKAFIALYPDCGRAAFDRDTPDAPIRILTGDKDGFATVRFCESRAKDGVAAGKEVEVIVYPDGYHGFDDNNRRTVSYNGKPLETRPNAKITDQARADVLNTLRASLGLSSTN